MAIRDERGYTKVHLNIGAWDMNVSVGGSANANVAHGLSATEWKTVRNINVLIRNDTDGAHLPLTRAVNTSNGDNDGFVSQITSANFALFIIIGGGFDTTAYDDTSALAEDNRGWISYEYIAD